MGNAESLRTGFGIGAFALSLLASLAGCRPAAPTSDEASADLVFRNAKVYTLDATRPWATSLAIRGERIAAIGADDDTAPLIGERTQVIDLAGRLVLPAFHDAHTHPVGGGLSYSQCPLYEGNTPTEYQRLIKRCMQEQPGTGWLYGIGWRDGVFKPEGVPTKELLDEIAPDRPVVFSSVGAHSLWLNSRALQEAGITRDTPDPPNGRIDRDAQGEPLGALQESAMDLVRKFLPPPSVQAREGALRYAQKYFNSVGIVGWQDASVPVSPEDPEQIVQTYASLHDKGELKAHAVLALAWDNARGSEQLADIITASERAAALGLEAKTVKFFLDGVLAQRTAALVEPYSDEPGFRGELQIPPLTLNDAVAQLDARNFQVHVHAIGDGAVRAALDAFEKARDLNGKKDNRHLISHVNLVTGGDLRRFADLNVTGVFQPLWARLDDYMRMTAERVGPERMKTMYPSGTLMGLGARVAFGSDWPVASANPFEGIEVALTRLDPGTTEGTALAPPERIALEDAIRNYALNSAYASHKDDESGSIAPGKSADIVVLDQDIFTVPVHAIAKTKVLLTLFAGQPVHGDVAAFQGDEAAGNQPGRSK